MGMIYTYPLLTQVSQISTYRFQYMHKIKKKEPMVRHGWKGVCTLTLHDQYSVVFSKKGNVQHKQKVVSSAYAVEPAAQWNSNATGKII